jgi:pyridoxine 5-phosphate synthase
MTLLSVNVNKVAVQRNSRGGLLPSVTHAAEIAILAGAGGITVHPRPDLRHIRPDDVSALAALCKRSGVEFNIEGNPYAPERGAYPGLLAMVAATQPTQVTLVPDSDGQITSDHGFDLVAAKESLSSLVAALKLHCQRVSIFVDEDVASLETILAIGADRIELYTGPYAERFESGDASASLAACANTAQQANRLGIGINAGHDLNQANLALFLSTVPDVSEVSIGHAIFNDALYDGLEKTVKAYRVIVDAAKS